MMESLVVEEAIEELELNDFFVVLRKQNKASNVARIYGSNDIFYPSSKVVFSQDLEKEKNEEDLDFPLKRKYSIGDKSFVGIAVEDLSDSEELLFLVQSKTRCKISFGGGESGGHSDHREKEKEMQRLEEFVKSDGKLLVKKEKISNVDENETKSSFAIYQNKYKPNIPKLDFIPLLKEIESRSSPSEKGKESTETEESKTEGEKPKEKKTVNPWKKVFSTKYIFLFTTNSTLIICYFCVNLCFVIFFPLSYALIGDSLTRVLVSTLCSLLFPSLVFIICVLIFFSGITYYLLEKLFGKKKEEKMEEIDDEDVINPLDGDFEIRAREDEMNRHRKRARLFGYHMRITSSVCLCSCCNFCIIFSIVLIVVLGIDSERNLGFSKVVYHVLVSLAIPNFFFCCVHVCVLPFFVGMFLEMLGIATTKYKKGDDESIVLKILKHYYFFPWILDVVEAVKYRKVKEVTKKEEKEVKKVVVQEKAGKKKEEEEESEEDEFYSEVSSLEKDERNKPEGSTEESEESTSSSDEEEEEEEEEEVKKEDEVQSVDEVEIVVGGEEKDQEKE